MRYDENALLVIRTRAFLFRTLVSTVTTRRRKAQFWERGENGCGSIDQRSSLRKLRKHFRFYHFGTVLIFLLPFFFNFSVSLSGPSPYLCLSLFFYLCVCLSVCILTEYRYTKPSLFVLISAVFFSSIGPLIYMNLMWASFCQKFHDGTGYRSARVIFCKSFLCA